MIKEGLMTFRVTLPYADNDIYQRSAIQTFEVPVDAVGSRARATVQQDIAMQTASGYWFVPTRCQGHRPQLCRAGPRWRDAFPCERGLITGHTPDRDMCQITVTSNNETSAQELSEGTFILQTLGENVRLACTGRAQEQATLDRGVYAITLGEGCILSGGRWALHGILRRYLSATASIKQLEVPRLDLMAIMWALPVANDTMPTVNLDFNIKEQYKPNYMSMNDNDGYPEAIIGHHLSWTAIGMITILCILCTCVWIWVFRRRFQIRFFFKDALRGARLAKLRGQGPDHSIKYSVKEPESVIIDPIDTENHEVQPEV